MADRRVPELSCSSTPRIRATPSSNLTALNGKAVYSKFARTVLPTKEWEDTAEAVSVAEEALAALMVVAGASVVVVASAAVAATEDVEVTAVEAAVVGPLVDSMPPTLHQPLQTRLRISPPQEPIQVRQFTSEMYGCMISLFTS